MTSESYFVEQENDWEPVQEGIKRKILPWTDGLMAVCVSFDKGAVGEVHAHDIHDQIAICLKGSFEVNLNGVKKVLVAGDAFLAPKGCPHGVVSLEDDSRLMDTFNPHRADFVS